MSEHTVKLYYETAEKLAVAEGRNKEIAAERDKWKELCLRSVEIASRNTELASALRASTEKLSTCLEGVGFWTDEQLQSQITANEAVLKKGANDGQG